MDEAANSSDGCTSRASDARYAWVVLIAIVLGCGDTSSAGSSAPPITGAPMGSGQGAVVATPIAGTGQPSSANAPTSFAGSASVAGMSASGAGAAMARDPSMVPMSEPPRPEMPVQPTAPAPTVDVPAPMFKGPWFACPKGAYPEQAVVVKTHSKVAHTAKSTKIDSDVALPEGSFKAIALRVEHECPTGGICDLYDRRAVVELVNPNEPREHNIELLRYVTTYRFNPGQTNYMCSFTDVTAYASLLRGKQKIRSWLDTVVNPGDDLGDGWQVSAELVFYPGPAADAVQVQELYAKFINIGEARGSVERQTPASTVMIPANATKVVAQLTVSGHGWGPENTDNCAEFCRLDQTIRVNGGAPHVINTFRNDCGSNPLAPLQQRNPTGSRNGWCPGAVVLAHKVDITKEVMPGASAEIDFGVQRPDGSEYIDADPTGFNPNELVSLQVHVHTR